MKKIWITLKRVVGVAISRTTVIGMVTIALGIAKMIKPDLGIEAPAEVLISGGLTAIYLRAGVAKLTQ